MELDLNLRVRVSELQGKLTEQVCFSPILCKRVSPEICAKGATFSYVHRL